MTTFEEAEAFKRRNKYRKVDSCANCKHARIMVTTPYCQHDPIRPFYADSKMICNKWEKYVRTGERGNDLDCS